MKHFPVLVLVAALVAAVSVPAQIKIEGRLGRHVRGSVVLGGHDARHHNHNEPVRRRPAPVHGHWETVHEQFLVPGYWHDEHLPPTYGWITDHCGHQHWGIIHQGGCRRVWVAARWETRCRQVWVSC